MAYDKRQGEVALGLFVDGLEVKFAHLGIKGKQVSVYDVKTANLVSRLEEQPAMEAGMLESMDAGTGATGDIFGGEAPTPTPAEPTGGVSEEITGAETNSSVILSLLSGFPPSAYTLGYSIIEPSIYYHVTESDFGLRGKKLRNRIMEELRAVRATSPSADALDYVQTEEGGLLCAIREDGTALMNTLDQLKSFFGNRPVRLQLIDTGEFALMNLVRANYELGPEEISLLVYVGREFTRLIFMKGSDFLHFAPSIGEGSDSSNIQNTVYSRVLLEQDTVGVTELNHIVLAGESQKLDFKSFFLEQFPNVDVDYLHMPYLDLTPLPAELQERVSEYAIPIATAWKLLEPDKEEFYPINLIPSSVLEEQRIFKVAWHGYLAMLLIFFLTVYFTSQIPVRLKELDAKQAQLVQLENQVKENQRLQARIDSMSLIGAKYQNELSLYERLIPGSDIWGRTISQTTRGVEDLNSVWLTDITTTDAGGMTMNGYAIFRSRVPRFTRLYENATLRQALVQEIRDKVVYKFTVEVPGVVPKAPPGAVPPETPAAGAEPGEQPG